MDDQLERSTQVGILLFEEVDLLDVGGPYEVFLTTSRLAQRRGDPPPFEVFTMGLSRTPVTAYGGLRLTPDRLVDETEKLDILVVPGALAIERVSGNPALISAIGDLSDRAELTTSVCTGAFLLSTAGLLESRPWTTHWQDIDELAMRSGSTLGRTGVHWVDDGDLVTAGGLSSGIAMALHVVRRYCGLEMAKLTARQIGYSWDPTGRS